MKRMMICVDCCMRLVDLTPNKARKLGWILWDGGGRCAKCERKRDEAAVELNAKPALATLRRDVTVVCSSCHKQLSGFEMTPNVFWPKIHWLVTDENRRRLKD